MRQFNLPQKYTTVTRIWINFALILLAVVFAFTPLLQLDLRNDKLATSVESIVGQVGEMFGEDDLDIEIPEKIDVSTVKLFKSLSLMGRFILTAMNASSGADEEAINASLQDLERELNSQEGQESFIMMMALISQAVDVENFLQEEGFTWNRALSNYSEEDLELALGDLYEKGAFNEYTLNTYLENQEKLFLADKAAYLKSIGCAEDAFDAFEDIPAVNVFTHLRTLTCAYIETKVQSYTGISLYVRYDNIPYYIEEYMNFGGENIYEGAMYGLYDFCNYYTPDLLKQHMDSFSVDVALGNQATKMVAVMTKEGVLSDAAYLNLMRELEDDDTELRYINLEELFEYLDLSEEELDSAFETLFAADAYYTVMGVDMAEAEKESSTAVASIKTVLNMMLTFYVVGYIILWPFILIIVALIALIRAIIATSKPQKSSRVHASMFGPLCFALSSLLLLTLFPGIVWGSGMIVIFILSLVSVIINVVASRLRAYNELDFKYVNLVQGAAALTGVGLIVYIISVLNTGFLRNFIDTMISYLAKMAAQLTVYNQEVKFYQTFFEQNNMTTAAASSGYLLDIALVAAASILALVVVSSVTKTVVARMGLVKFKASASAIPLVAPILALISCILPIVANSLQSKVAFVRTADGVSTVADGSLFAIGDGLGALIGMFIGTALMLGASITFLVLRQKFCSDLSAIAAKQIRIGNAPAYGSTEEAVDEENSSEEASAEETPAEEASAEEAPAEETPAEETPVEENTEA